MHGKRLHPFHRGYSLFYCVLRDQPNSKEPLFMVNPIESEE